MEGVCVYVMQVVWYGWCMLCVFDESLWWFWVVVIGVIVEGYVMGCLLEVLCEEMLCVFGEQVQLVSEVVCL